MDILKSKDNPKWRYFWWKIKFRHRLIDSLEIKWPRDLPDFNLFIHNVNEQSDDFDPTNYLDSELYIEKLIKIAKELRKNKAHFLQQRNSDFFFAKIFCFYNFFDLLN